MLCQYMQAPACTYQLSVLVCTIHGVPMPYPTGSCLHALHCLPPTFQTLDFETIKNLELLANARTGATAESLFGVLDHTQTMAGMRFLRSQVSTPHRCNFHTVFTQSACAASSIIATSLYALVVAQPPPFFCRS